MSKISSYEELVKYLLHVTEFKGKCWIEISVVEGYDISNHLTTEFREKLITLVTKK